MNAGVPDLSGWDYAAFRLGQRDPRLTANFVAVIELSQEPDWNQVKSRLTTAISEHSVLRWRINQDETGLEAVPEVNLSDCVKAVPVGSRIGSIAAELVTRKFQPGEYLWRIRAARHSKRPVILAAFNHAVADGQSGLELLRLLETDVKFTSTIGGQPSEESTGRIWQQLLSDLILRPGPAVGAINSLVKSFADLWQGLSGGQSANRPARSGALKTDWFELPGLRSSLGQSAKLAASAAQAYASYSEAQGEAISTVSLNLPIAVRASGGNQITVIRHHLPVSELTDMTREVARTYRRWTQDPALQLAGQLAEIATSLPGDFLRDALQQADLTVTLLPAPNLPKQIGGAPVRAVYPTVGTGGAAANVSVLATGDSWFVGTTWDSAVLGDDWADFLADSLSQAFEVESRPARLHSEAPNAR